MPEDVAAKVGALDAEIDAISDKRHAYDANVIAHGGVFVVLNHDGTVRIERGFVRAEDEALADPQPGGEAIDPETVEDEQAEGDEDEEVGKPISDALTRDLSAHRTLALRVALGERPDMALIALTHTLTSQLFYSYAEAGCLEVRPTVTPLGSHADGIEDTPLAAKANAAHEAWVERMPRDVADCGPSSSLSVMRTGRRCWRIAWPAPSMRCICRGIASPGRCKPPTGWQPR